MASDLSQGHWWNKYSLLRKKRRINTQRDRTLGHVAPEAKMVNFPSPFLLLPLYRRCSTVETSTFTHHNSPNKDEKIWIKFITSLMSCKWQKESCFTLLENSCTCSFKKMQYFIDGMVSSVWHSLFLLLWTNSEGVWSWWDVSVSTGTFS